MTRERPAERIMISASPWPAVVTSPALAPRICTSALVPTVVLFLATGEWRRPWRGARPLGFAIAAVVLAFAALYYLEHYR